MKNLLKCSDFLIRFWVSALIIHSDYIRYFRDVFSKNGFSANPNKQRIEMREKMRLKILKMEFLRLKVYGGWLISCIMPYIALYMTSSWVLPDRFKECEENSVICNRCSAFASIYRFTISYYYLIIDIYIW